MPTPTMQTRGREPDRHMVDRVEEVHPVHAEHDQLGVADPDDVDDAEHQVQSERQKRQDTAQQDTVDQRLEQVDVEDAHGGSDAEIGFADASLSSSSAAVPAARILPASST